VVNAEYPRALPGQWTVVAIAMGVGTGEGARPLPAGGDTANPPPRPACGAPPPPTQGAGAVPGLIPGGKPCPGTMNFWCEPVGLSLIAPRQGSRPFPEEVDD